MIERIGIVEVLLAIGPLVVVPLGLALLPPTAPRVPRGVLLTAATGVALAVWCPPGTPAAVLTGPWLVVTIVIATAAVTRAAGDVLAGQLDAVAALRLIAVGWLPLAAGAITMSAGGATALGISPELVRLTGVHLNYAGFAATVIVAELLGWARRHGRRRPGATIAAVLTVGGAMLVAVGHLTVRVLELAGAVGMTVGVVTVGILTWRVAPRRSVARVLLRVSGLSVLGSMGFALAYSWSLTVGAEHLPYTTIAAVHGTLNAFGFTVCGLLGWLALQRHHPALCPPSHPTGRASPRVLQRARG